ncbi:hypothetical protein D521_0435 [beta proteobacterium CB]|nr:hypothetical protein D521_0435 [beta proteobacterium CB]
MSTSTQTNANTLRTWLTLNPMIKRRSGDIANPMQIKKLLI